MGRVPSSVIFAVHASPWGPLHVAVRDRSVVGLEMHTTSAAFMESVARRLHAPLDPAGTEPFIAHVRRQLDEYAAGRRRRFELPLALEGASDWDRAVLEGVQRVGFGEVTSYGRLAAMIGRRGAARAVGGAVGRNPIGLLIPCHRIVAGDGSLGGYGGSWFGAREELLELKASLLAHEGVAIPAGRFVA
jgi:methylated-DNA-[protein]-cysteine S-methyltransferase